MKFGLVLSGGGARGAYQVGAIKALKELGFNYEVVTGTSVGALNALLLVANQFDLLLNVWKNIDHTSVIDHDYKYKNKSLEILVKAPFKNGFSINPLENLLKEHLNEDNIRNSNIKGGLVYTEGNMQYREIRFDEIPKNQIIDYTMASCSAYPFLKKRKINNKECYDGFFSDNTPINLATDLGAEKIIVIEIMFSIKRKLKNKNTKILYLKCKKGLPFFLNFDNDKINELIEIGYKETMDRKEEILKFINEKEE